MKYAAKRRRIDRASSSKRTPARRWFSKWIKEESFWREMTTRTLSALVAAYIIFQIASGVLIVGLDRAVLAIIPFYLVGMILAFGVVAVLVVFALIGLIKLLSGKSRRRKIVAGIIGGILITGLLVVGFLAAFVALAWFELLLERMLGRQ